MSFEAAKQHFVVKTKEAPKKIEDGWKAFKSGTENYFDKKQKTGKQGKHAS